MHRLPISLLAAGFAAAISGAAYAQTPTETTRPQTTKPQTTKPDMKDMPTRDAAAHGGQAMNDQQFAQHAAMGGQKEVASAKFAAGKARHADVKALANKLVTDHTKANTELMTLMRTKKITPEKAAKGESEPWRSQSGAAFDRAWLDHVIEHHEKDIAMFEAESNNGEDAELKAWAGQKLPALREHLKMAQDAKAKLSTTSIQ